MINGAGYNPHPTDCSKFVQCNTNAFNQVIGTEQQCGFGTYWDKDKMICQFANLIDCPTERCLTLKEGDRYRGEGNCRGYWKCEGYKSVAYCCEKGYKFENGYGCVENDTCEDLCFNEVEVEEECNKRAVTKMPSMYEELVEGHGWVLRHCAPGTVYIHANCSCALAQDTVAQEIGECKPEIYLSFDTNTTEDMSGKNNHVTNEHVTVEDGVAIFKGNSRLVIPRFTNLEHSDTVVITVKYNSTGKLPAGARRAIVSNADCGQQPSIMITEDDSTVEFGVRTSDVLTSVSVPQTMLDEKEIAYVFSEGSLAGMTFEGNDAVNVNGTLRNVHCALQIGHAQSHEPFVGEIDELTVYLCKPKSL